MAQTVDLMKLFVTVPAGTTFNGATATLNAPQVFFEEATQTIWAKGKAYGISKTLADQITANKNSIDKLITLIGASEKGADAQTILARLEAVEYATSKPIVVKEGDKVLTMTVPAGEGNTTLEVTIGLAYDEVNKKIQLTGKPNVGEGASGNQIIAEIDATKFIKDGMVDNTSLVVNPEGYEAGTYIKIVFNTEAGKDPIFINVTSLIDTYTSGNTDLLTVSGYVITPVVGEIKENSKGLAAAADVYTVTSALDARVVEVENSLKEGGATAQAIAAAQTAATAAQSTANNAITNAATADGKAVAAQTAADAAQSDANAIINKLNNWNPWVLYTTTI